MKRLIPAATVLLALIVGGVALYARPWHDCNPISVVVSGNSKHIFLTIAGDEGAFCGRLTVEEAKTLIDDIRKQL